jgi:Na+-translocating ferredoxin:NAD+ oxidoreductase RnfG subunit
MKKFFNKNYPILVLSLLLVVIFVFGGMFSRYMTSQTEIHARDNELIEIAGKGDKVVIFETEQLVKQYPVPGSETAFYQPELLRAYKILEDKEEIVVIYVISTQGRSEGLEVAYAIDIASKTLIDIKVLANNETPDYYNDLDRRFFSQLSDKDLDDPVFKLDSVSGSTLSSKAFETGMKYARELFGRDFDFEVPNLPYEIIDVSRNFDAATMVAKPFVVSLTWGEDTTAFSGYFDNDFTLVEAISGTAPEQAYLDVLATVLPNSDIIDVTTFVTAYDSTTRIVTFETKGYGGRIIKVEAELNTDLDAYEAMTITTDQSYDQSYEYTGGNPPAVENAYRDQFLSDGTIIDSYTGATITSNAMDRLMNLAKGLLNDWNGGGN